MSKTWCILVVDDDALLRWSLQERLQEWSYCVLGAGSGRDALKQCSSGVDLVLLDFRLPDTDGLAVATAIKHLKPSCPVILMTGHGTPEVLRKAAHTGVYGVVEKPFDLDGMARLVGRALSSRPLPQPRLA